MSTTDSDFHDDDLAELRKGRSRARTASARREAGGSPPPPPPPAPQVSDDATSADRAADQPRSSTAVADAPAERAPEAESATATDTKAAPVDAPVDGLSGGEAEPAKQAPSRRGKRRARSAPRSAEEPSTTQGAFSANVPTSIVEAADADPRPRANLLREAFENHVEAVVEANPAKAPSKLGLEPTREPRASTEGDPFQRVLFRFRPHEKEILDKWKNKTSMSRSAFVTELLRLELHG